MEIFRATSYIFICKDMNAGNESNSKQSFPGPRSSPNFIRFC